MTRLQLPLLALCASLLTMLSTPAEAQDAPRGIYCSCGPTTASGGSSYTPAIAAKSFVDGFLVRVPWADVETSPSVFDWSLIDDQVAKVATDGKRIALAVVQGGSGTPAWLAGLGAQTVSYSFAGQTQTIALAWDPVYLARWTAFVSALGARYDGEPTIALVHATHATHNGFEMQLGLSQQALYASLGYSEAVYAGSWFTVLDAFAAAFPSKPIDVDAHPIFGDDQVAEDVVAYGLAAIGPRFGAFSAWWSVDNAFDVYPGMYALLLATAPQTFATVQNVGSWITTPERYDFDLNEYEAAYDLALDAGVRYVEVWNQDLLAPELQGLLLATSEALHCPGWSMLYGAGTAGSGGAVPALDVSGCPSPGTVATLALTDALGGSVGLLGVGTQRDAFALLGGTAWIGPASNLVVVPFALSGAGAGDGAWSFAWSVPPLVPPVITAQALVVDAAAAEGLAFSNAVEIRVH